MAELYLHIGLPKTATSSLQNFLFEDENRKLLEKHGICYPDTGCRYERINERRNGHFLVASAGDFEDRKSREQLREIYEKGLDRLAGLAEQYDKIILSDESIWKRGHARPKFWPQLKADLDKRNLDVRIIVYFRRQDLWLESYYAQEIRAGKNSETLKEFIEYLRDSGYPLDYYRYMNELSSLFGKERLIVRVFEAAQFRGAERSIYSDFLDIFGLSLDEGFHIGKERWNTRYEGDLLECRRILGSLREYQAAFHPLRSCFDLLRDKQLVDFGKKYSYFTPEERRQFLASFAESNRKLALEYFEREDGVLYYATPDSLPVYQVNQYELTRAFALLFARKIADIDARDRKLEKELACLRAGTRQTSVKKKRKRLFGKG